MIILEITFGIINGNPISVDSQLDTTSTNPVENRVIAAAIAEIQNSINHAKDELDDKEVIIYATKTALDKYIEELIADEDQEKIDAATEKLYYAENTNTLYKFDGTELHEIGSEYIIINGDTTARDNALASYLTTGVHKVIWINGSITSLYTFTVERSTRICTQTLIYKTGYMYRTCDNPGSTTPLWGAFTTKTYSFVGHTHTAAEITDFDTAISGKQDSTPTAGSLRTTATTIVGAINEVHEKVNAKRILAINFYDDEIDFAQWHNIIGRKIKILAISKNNIQTVYISDGGSIVHQNTETLLQNRPIEIANGSTVTLDIVRAQEGFASLTLSYELAE
jgi:hypothetical protein